MFETIDWNAFIVLLNTIFVAIFTYYSRKQLKVKEEEVDIIKNGHTDEKNPNVEELWNEVNDLRGTLNKTLLAVNKQLRGHGRTAQAEAGKSDFSNARPGMIRPPVA